MKLQKLGGYAAIAGICFLAIFGIMEGPVADMMDAAKMMAALSAKPTHFAVLYLFGIIAAILIFVMFLGLHERMQTDAVYLTRTMLIAASATLVLGIAILMVFQLGGGTIIVPAQDVSAFRALTAIALSLSTMVHHTLGWAYLLLGCAILKTRSFSRILGWLFIYVGIVAIPTSLFPQLQLRVVSILQVSSTLLWFIATVWIGIALLRQKQPQPVSKEIAAS
jgi:hypothetical protein